MLCNKNFKVHENTVARKLSAAAWTPATSREEKPESPEGIRGDRWQVEEAFLPIISRLRPSVL
jgi:hypothetical protein